MNTETDWRAALGGLAPGDAAEELDVYADVMAGLGLASSSKLRFADGRYELADKLGQGGAGVVYSAIDRELDRKVAIKLVRSASGDNDRWLAADLLREAQAIASVSHPNIVDVFDVGRYEQAELFDGEAEGVFVVMELVEGSNLRTWLATPRLESEILRVFLDAGRGLVAAHAAGIVHRDFKPENVLLTSDGRVKVADFGLARPIGGASFGSSVVTTGVLESPPIPGDRHDAPATARSAIAGTLPYMAPEQFAGRTDPRSDQYAFCVSLFEALSGRRLFSGSPMRMLAQKKAGPPSTARLPNRIGNVIRRGLHPEPQLRFASMEALLDALSPRPREARWAAWLGVVVLGAAGLGLVSESEPGPCIDPPRWDSARREALAASLQQRGESARPVARQAVEALDRDVEATRIEIGRVCDDGAGAPERERRIACLHRRVARIDTTVDVLLEDGSRAATHALEVIDDLGERSGCDGPNLPPPADPATRFEARRIAAILYRARALADLGDPLACRSPISRTSSSRPRSPKRRSDTGGGHS